ncbi:MAG: protease SohB [Legionellaceae bacterium]|nr:protease SohB [Legionellaceae bacterium]
MHHPWLGLGLFAIETLIIVIAIVAIFIAFFTLLARGKLDSKKNRLKIENLNKKYQDMQSTLQEEILDKKAFKQFKKNIKTKNKNNPRLFVLQFKGDMTAKGVGQLRDEITMILTSATEKDEVLLQLESPGGEVTNYGLAASQLQRIRTANIPLTVAVDRVAASGGYMMACVANRILAAPFAVLGSIGVVLQAPNVHQFLKSRGIDVELLTAGENKRNLTLLGKNTDEDRQKAQTIIDDIHQQFIEHVKTHRPQVEIEKIAKGDFWFGARALELKLIDEINTSDDYLLQATKKQSIYQISTQRKKRFIEKIIGTAKAEFQSILNNKVI